MNTLLTHSNGGLETKKNGYSNSILLLENDPELRRSIALSLQQDGIRVFEAANNHEAFNVLESETPSLLLLDRDSSTNCGTIIEQFREKSLTQVKYVLMITLGRLEAAWRKQYRPDAVIYKPFDIRYLHRQINKFINTKETEWPKTNKKFNWKEM